MGTPEGLFAERPELAAEVKTWLIQEPALQARFALDPNDVILRVTNSPLFVIPFVPGQ